MSDFVAGFAARDGVGELLAQAFAPVGFSPADLRERAIGPRSFVPAGPGTQPAAGVAFDPIREAHAAGYAEGLAAAAANDSRDRGLTGDIADALANRVDRERVAGQLRQTILFLVAKIVGETGVSPDLLARRVHAASDLLGDSAESAILRVNPTDVALLEGLLPDNVFAIGDAAVAHGSFVMESASTIIEDGPALWLDQLAQAIDRVAVPAAGIAA